MDFITMPLAALAVSWIFRKKIINAFTAGREPMVWYGMMCILCIVAGTQYGTVSSLGVLGVAVYVYVKTSAAAHHVEWKGFLHYAPNSVLPRQEDQKLLR